MKDLPRPVQKAVIEQNIGATLRRLSKEVDPGKTEYEAELLVNGHTRDISFDSAGNIVSVEEETAIDKVPVAARAEIEKAEGGKIQRSNWSPGVESPSSKQAFGRG